MRKDEALEAKPEEEAPASEQLLTKTQVAAFVQMTARTIDNWMARGLLPYFKIGHSVRFRLDDVKAHLASSHLVIGQPPVRRPTGSSHHGAKPGGSNDGAKV